jgi:ABC-type uncharacterized transport system
MSDASPPIAPQPAPAAPTPPVALAALTAETPRTGPALLAAGLLLAVMTAWIRYGGFDPPAALPALLVGLGAAICFGLGLMRLVGQGSRSASAAIAGAGSIALLGVAGWLGAQFGLDALGQAIGLGLFALLGLGVAVGWSGGTLRDRLPSSLVTRIALFAAGFVVLALFIYLRAVRRIGADFWPEQIALFLLGFVLLFAAVWLYATTNRSAEFLTTFFLIVGSSIGTILTLYAISRGILDWSTLRTDPKAWIVGYALLAGLGLIYFSLNLAADRVGTSAVARQSIFGFATLFCGILGFAILVLFNIFVYRTVNYTMEWSKTRGLTTLSSASQNLLAGLDKKVEAYVLLSPQHGIYLQMKTLLDNAHAFAPGKFEVTYINPDSANEAERKKFDLLAGRFKELVSAGGREDQDGSRGVLLVYGPLPDDPNVAVPHAVIPARRLYEQQMKSFTFKGEAEVMKEIDFLARKREKQRIYMLQGNNELDMNEQQPTEFTLPGLTSNLSKLGAGKLVANLTKDNYDVRGLSFQPANPDDKETNIEHVSSADGKKAEVPADCETLVILSPSAKLPSEGIDAIERYLDRGGRLFVGIGIPREPDFSKLKETGLEDLLKKYGVDVTSEFVLHLPHDRDPSFFFSAVNVAKGETVLGQQFAERQFTMIVPRIIKPGTTAKYKVEPLLVCDPRQYPWAESSLNFFRADPERLLAARLAGRSPLSIVSPRPLPVGVTMTQDAKPRMVVIGSGEFLSNLMFRTEQGRNNYDLMVSSLAWMGQRSFLGPRPVESVNYPLAPNADFGAMTFGAIWTLIALLLVIGGCIWIVRRR